MKIAVVHYHFGLSGVTKVISSASRAMTAMEIPHVILADDPMDALEEGLPVKLVTGLGYTGSGAVPDVDDLLERMRKTAREALGGDPDIWHFHNHSLGKNVMLPEVVARLAEDRQKLVLQIHDMVEDGRQLNYSAIPDVTRLYPNSEGVHYVFLNEQDRRAFAKTELDEQRTTVMVNPLEMTAVRESKAEGNPILFAPVRGIRRKNVGELVLLSAIAPAGTRIAISRAPTDRPALALHEVWRKFAGHLRLPIGFDVVGRYHPAEGATSDFDSWVDHSSHFVSTSVSEGFGLTLLEAAAYGKPLIGRKIARVDEEHQKHQIRCGDLYDKLLVPIEWVDQSILRQHFDTSIERNYRHLGRQLETATAERTFKTLIHDGWLDFGNMPEQIQQAVVERLTDPECRKLPRVVIGDEVRPAKEWMHEVLKKRSSSVDAKQLKPFRQKAYGKGLKQLYGKLMEADPGKPSFIEPGPVLDAHMSPESFHFLTSVIPPKSATWSQYKAVIFDIYGTLLVAPGGGVSEPDPTLDGLLQAVLEQHGYEPPESPSEELYDAVLRHHDASEEEYPEVDLRVLWRQILGLDPHQNVTDLVVALESECRPSQPMPGAAAFIRRLAHSGVSLGLLSNGQCNTLRSLGGIREFFSPELSLISYEHGIAKPSPALFQLMVDRLATRGIRPEETLFIGNDPINDIIPAANCGFKTALFTGHPESLRPGNCSPDHEIHIWPVSKGMRRC